MMSYPLFATMAAGEVLLAPAKAVERGGCARPRPPLQLSGAPVSYAAFAAAILVKLEQHLVSMGTLRQYLVDQPKLVWLLSFPLSQLGLAVFERIKRR
jgi:hypothetical protein